MSMYSLADTNCRTSLATCFQLTHDREKQRTYEQYVHEVERASFTLLVFWGMSKPTEITYKILALLLATKQNQQYYVVISFNHCRLSLRAAIWCLCLHGSLSNTSRPQRDVSVAVSEGRLPLSDWKKIALYFFVYLRFVIRKIFPSYIGLLKCFVLVDHSVRALHLIICYVPCTLYLLSHSGHFKLVIELTLSIT